MESLNLLHTRYSGDIELLNALLDDAIIGKQLNEVNTARHRNLIRTKLLGTAVRINSELLPMISNSINDLRLRAGISNAMEAYVYHDSAINAFVTKGHSHLFVVLSSGAVNSLSNAELQFVIGHELGHAIFDHVELSTAPLLETGDIPPKGCMQILAWKRASEISADRVGLICCGSLSVAVNTLFKSISGLNIDGMDIDPVEFSKQWEALEQEVTDGGDDDFWHLSHPFPPLRVKAMLLFSSSIPLLDNTLENIESFETAKEAADHGVDNLLSMMDPISRSNSCAADPLLAGFFLWGGLYLALSNGVLEDSEVEKLRELTSESLFNSAISGEVPEIEDCMSEFCACLEKRHRKLSSLEIHRIFEGLLHIAFADGGIDSDEVNALKNLGKKLRISPNACELFISKFLKERMSNVTSRES